MSDPSPTAALDIRVVHATDRYVVVDKPAGLLSVPGKGELNSDCVAARVARMFPDARGPLVVHRLDMDTSGLIVLGLDPDAQRHLSAQFEARSVDKAYTALVDGLVPRDEGTIDLPVRPDLTRRPYQVVDLEHHRPAVTRFRVLAFETDRTRLELVPMTGRTHQLRVHCAYAGPGGLTSGAPGRAHPILGDPLYGPPTINPDHFPRLMLHASRLAFTEPPTGSSAGLRVEFTSMVPF